MSRVIFKHFTPDILSMYFNMLINMKSILFWIVVGVTKIEIARADGEYCTDLDRQNSIFWCDHGCCKSWPYEECCDDWGWLGWAIAGGVICGILLLSFIVCVVCVCIKQKGKAGQVIQPQPTSMVSHVTTYPQSQGIYPQYATTSFIQNPSAPPPPPSYQTIYGQQQQPLPPFPSSLQGQHQQGQQQSHPPPIGFK